MLRNVLIFVGLLFISACQTQSGPTIITDHHTGLSGARSEMVKAGYSSTAYLNGTAVYESSVGYGVMLFSQASSWQFYKSAWSHGRRLPFQPLSKKVDHCYSGGCQLLENSFIKMTEAEFRQYAKVGFSFKLLGDYELEGTIPARAFQQVLSLKQKP